MKLLIFSQFADGPNQTVLNIFSKQDYTAAFTVIKVGKSQGDEILAQVVSPSYWKLQLFITWFFWDGMYLKGALTVQIVSASHSSGLGLSIELLIFWYRVKCVWFTCSTVPLPRNHLRNSATTPTFWQQEPLMDSQGRICTLSFFMSSIHPFKYYMCITIKERTTQICYFLRCEHFVSNTVFFFLFL